MTAGAIHDEDSRAPVGRITHDLVVLDTAVAGAEHRDEWPGDEMQFDVKVAHTMPPTRSEACPGFGNGEFPTRAQARDVMRRREREHSNRMRTRVRKEVLERTQDPELVRAILERSMYGKIFRAKDDAAKNGGNKCNIGAGKSFAWLITDQYGGFNDTYFELLADAAARIVDKEYGVGTGVDEDEKAAKISAVKTRLTRQLTGGIIKAAARFYRLRLERACTLASSPHNAALEAEPIDPGLLGGASLLHADPIAFDGPADDASVVNADTRTAVRDGPFLNGNGPGSATMDMYDDDIDTFHDDDALMPLPIRRGGAGLYLRLPRRRGLRGFVQESGSSSANNQRRTSPGPMVTFF
jgi:hypothetical protein